MENISELMIKIKTPQQEFEELLNFSSRAIAGKNDEEKTKFAEFIKNLNSSTKIYPFFSLGFSMSLVIFFLAQRQISWITKLIVCILYIFFTIYTVQRFKE